MLDNMGQLKKAQSTFNIEVKNTHSHGRPTSSNPLNGDQSNIGSLNLPFDSSMKKSGRSGVI